MFDYFGREVMFEELYNNTLKDLPVNEVSDDVMQAVDESVTIISSPTGSGKTLTIPAKLADKIPDNERVVVLVPRKFLAINAAETVAELSDTSLGEEVGYAVGTQGGDEPLFSKRSKIIFATYGYAISSGMIFYEKNIVLDEVHEASMDMSIAKALLHYRKTQGDPMRLIEMSATINLEKQKEYWKQFNPKTFESEGRTFDCEIIEDNNKSSAEHAVDLILNKNRKGVAVFESGVANIEDTKDAIETLLLSKDIKNVEVASIYGEMDKKERDKALKAPQNGFKKILIGTNVIESGMNIPWLDAGVTSGKGKDLFVTSSGAIALKEQDLPQWRLQQQKGRVCRFTDGIFVLASYTKWNNRDKETTPEISRLPLSSLVMDCASFDLKAEDLNFDAYIDHNQLLAAKDKLKRLKLIDEDGKLTNLGKFSNDLPVTVENAVTLKYAQSREYCLPQAIVMTAISEQGNLRQNFRQNHGLDDSSDLFDGLKAFVATDKELKKLKRSGIQRKELEARTNQIFFTYNMNKKRFFETKELIRDLRHRLGVRFSTDSLEFDYDKLRQCLIAGHIEKLNIDGMNIFNRNSYDVSNSSTVRASMFYLAEPRVITPKNGGRSFTVNENVTALSADDIKTYIRKNPDVISKVDDDKDFHILDSSYIGNYKLKEFVTDAFKARVAEAMKLLEEKGVDEFRNYTEKNNIPVPFWKDILKKEHYDDLICDVLSAPRPKKNFDLFKILNEERSNYNSSVYINEKDILKLGLIKDNKLDLKINPVVATHFEIQNPDLVVNMHICGDASNTLMFDSSTLKEINLSSENDNFNNIISLEGVTADRISLSHLKASEIKAKHSKSKDLLFDGVDTRYVELDYSQTKDVKFSNSSVNQLDFYYMNLDKKFVFDNSKILNVSTGKSTTLKGEKLFVSAENGEVFQSNRDPEEDKKNYANVTSQISDEMLSNTTALENLVNEADLSDAYKEKLRSFIHNKKAEIKIKERKEAIKKMGLKVAQNIPDENLENTGYKEIAKTLSQMDEFKPFAKGDITEDEFSDLIIQPVETRKEDVYNKTLEENNELIRSEISTSEKIEEIKKRLKKVHGLNIRDNDILTIQNEKAEQEKEAERQEKLSHIDEFTAQELLNFFDNEETHGYDYFNAVGRDRRNLGYENIAKKVMNKLGYEISDSRTVDDETYFLFLDVKDKVINIERESNNQSYYDEDANEWIYTTREFLEEKAGIEHEKSYQEEELISPEENKKRLKEAKKAAKGQKSTSITDLSGLAALKEKFNSK